MRKPEDFMNTSTTKRNKLDISFRMAEAQRCIREAAKAWVAAMGEMVGGPLIEGSEFRFCFPFVFKAYI